MLRAHRYKQITLSLLGPSLIQVEDWTDIELSGDDVRALHLLCHDLVPGENFALVLIRNGDYSLSFEAMRILFDVPQLEAVAFVLHHPQQEFSVRTILAVAKDAKMRKVRMFNSQAEAFAWLDSIGIPVEYA